MADTIFALATARGRAGVAVIRVSGPLAYDVAKRFAGTGLPVSGRSLRNLHTPDGRFIDQALVLTFPQGASFTGEAVVELHCHGSGAVIRAILTHLSQMDGLREAEAGEFTRRALENGVMDLTQVEGLGALIEAETEAQRVQAARVMQGVLADKVASWRSRLLKTAGLIEAQIDFSEEDIPDNVVNELINTLSGVIDDLSAEVAGTKIAQRIRDGFEVAIVGPPNIGKSTLLNYLAGREAAITSETAGTTRDVIEVQMEIAGLPVTLLDTAGIRETGDEIEKLGVKRAIERATAADIRVFLQPDEAENTSELAVLDGDIVAIGKADQGQNGSTLSVSGLTGLGVDALIDRISTVLEERTLGSRVALTERHRLSMTNANSGLQAVVQELENAEPDYEIAGEELRRSLHSLAELVGKVDVEDVLGEIFSNFCIGK